MRGVQPELATLREELAGLRKDFDSLLETNTFLQSDHGSMHASLAAAEQRNAELLEILRSIRLNASPKLFSLGQLALVDAALKPTESGASE